MGGLIQKRENIVIIQCMRVACERLTAVTREFRLNLEHRTFIIIASAPPPPPPPGINVVKRLVLSFVFMSGCQQKHVNIKTAWVRKKSTIFNFYVHGDIKEKVVIINMTPTHAADNQ